MNTMNSNVSNCSSRFVSSNRELPLRKQSDADTIHLDTHFEDLKLDVGKRTDHVYDIHQSESIKKSQPNNEQSKSYSRKCSSYRGSLFAALSGASYLFSSVIVKYIRNISSAELAMFRYFGIFVFSLPFAIYSQENPFGPKNTRHLIFFTSLFVATNAVFKFISFKYLPLGDATIIVSSSPALTTVLARLFLKESCGYFQFVTVLLTLVGLILISKLSRIAVKINDNYITNDYQYIYGVGAAIGAMILASFGYIFVKKMTNVSSLVISFNVALLASIETPILTYFSGEFEFPGCGLEQWLVILLGIFGLSAQMLLFMALKNENAGTVTIIRVGVDIVLAFICQIWFFNEIPDNYSISGAVLICLAVLLINILNCFSC